MKFPTASRRDHEKFCKNDEWTCISHGSSSRRRGKSKDHYRYELELDDGRVVGPTKISHPVNGATYGQDLWKRILRDQLEVSEEQFWACVKSGVRPDR